MERAGKLLLASGLSLLVFSSVAFAQVDSRDADRVLARDREAFDRMQLDRFGIRFNRHTEVCTDAESGSAHCDSRVLVDDSGSPLVTADGARPARATPKTAPPGLGPAQFLSAYGLTGFAASPRIIAIVDAYHDPHAKQDLDTYSSTFGIPTLPLCSGAITSSAVPCFKQVNQRGTTSFPRTDSGWALEISLDVQAAHALCQNCSILLVEASSNSFSNLMAAVDRAVLLGANVVSNSYGAPEFSGETSYDSHFAKSGVAFTVSAGDSGYGVEYPAASSYVTSVGGTSLFLNPDGSYNSEAVWSGTGSGCSAYESKQPWQIDSGCSKRTVADVSADADPNTGAAVYDSVGYGGRYGWFQVGGTSLSSPIIAAVYALSGNTSGAANSIPYAQGSASTLHDVIVGSNGSCGTYLCMGAVGYDGPTGLGTPAGFAAF